MNIQSKSPSIEPKEYFLYVWVNIAQCIALTKLLSTELFYYFRRKNPKATNINYFAAKPTEAELNASVLGKADISETKEFST